MIQEKNSLSKRCLEVEVMDTAQEAQEYEDIDNRDVNREFAQRALRLCPPSGRVLEVGTGPAHIAILLAQGAPALHVTAIDLAEQMLVLARRNVNRSEVADRVDVLKADAKATGLKPQSFDMIICNSMVHHLPEPGVFFREAQRVSRPGAGLFIKDLLRPESERELGRLVRLHASDCSEYQKNLFSDSLRAALTLAEVEQLCSRTGLTGVEVERCSNRHWSISRLATCQ